MTPRALDTARLYNSRIAGAIRQYLTAAGAESLASQLRAMRRIAAVGLKRLEA
jgi:hypothetical protein